MILKRIAEGIAAGIMISIGGCVFLTCLKDGNKALGAILFSIALLVICYKGFSLYTGKIGFIIENHDKEAFSVLLLGLLGNAIATILIGFAVQYAFSDLQAAAETICDAKLTQSFGSAFLRSVMCGILMYLAVNIYRENKTIVGILFAIPVFILSGFEHSIANMFYFSVSGIVSWNAFGYLWLIVLGNTLGAFIFPLLAMVGKKKNKKEVKK